MSSQWQYLQNRLKCTLDWYWRGAAVYWQLEITVLKHVGFWKKDVLLHKRDQIIFNNLVLTRVQFIREVKYYSWRFI